MAGNVRSNGLPAAWRAICVSATCSTSRSATKMDRRCLWLNDQRRPASEAQLLYAETPESSARREAGEGRRSTPPTPAAICTDVRPRRRGARSAASTTHTDRPAEFQCSAHSTPRLQGLSPPLAAAGILMVAWRAPVDCPFALLNASTGLGIASDQPGDGDRPPAPRVGAVQPIAGAIADRYGPRGVLFARLQGCPRQRRHAVHAQHLGTRRLTGAAVGDRFRCEQLLRADRRGGQPVCR